MDSIRFPAVVVHSLADARSVLAIGAPVTLLSAEGAALYAGCGWWQALVSAARMEFPQVAIDDFLDCANASGQALAALRTGLRHLILTANAPGRERVAEIVSDQEGILLANRPPALDVARPGAGRRLHEWVLPERRPDDSSPGLR
jgi:hypothetical protein